MKTISIFISLLVIITFFMMLYKIKQAKDLKLKYSINKEFFESGYFTNEYHIDSLGQVHFKDEIDSVNVIISGSYTISENNWK